jgi:hypothetical protein
MENQISLSNLSVVELKALAYDNLIQLEIAQTNLRAINQELSKKLNTQQNLTPPTPTIEPFPLGSIKTI